MKLIIPASVVESALLVHLKNIGFIIPNSAKITTSEVEIAILMQNSYVRIGILDNSQFIPAIKSLRQAACMGLKESKDMIESARVTGRVGPLTYDQAVLFCKYLSENNVASKASIEF